MKKYLLFILVAFLFTQKIYSQNSLHDSLYLNALFLEEDKKYDSALLMYNYLYINAGYKYYSRALYYIASVQQKIGNEAMADSLYKMCLQDTNSHSEFEKYYSSLKLADSKIKKKEFQEALNFLTLHKTYSPNIFCSGGSNQRNLSFVWKSALCLNELENVDSAINLLTPFMFKGKELLSYREEYYDSLNNFYYKLLLKKYNKCSLQLMVFDAIKLLQYSQSINKTIPITFEESDPVKIQSYLTFLNKKIWFLDYTTWIDNKNPHDEAFGKRTTIKTIQQSGLYKLIME